MTGIPQPKFTVYLRTGLHLQEFPNQIGIFIYREGLASTYVIDLVAGRFIFQCQQVRRSNISYINIIT